jgi:hypothetical protein
MLSTGWIHDPRFRIRIQGQKAPDPGSSTLMLRFKNKKIYNLAELIMRFKEQGLLPSSLSTVLRKLGCYLPYLTLGIFSARFRHCARIGTLLADAGRLAGALRVRPAANLHCKGSISRFNNPLTIRIRSKAIWTLRIRICCLGKNKDGKN